MKYRKHLAAVLLTAATLTACRERSFTAEPVDYVSTLVGTMSKPSLSTGNTYPAVARPWGTHFWTPQTGPSGDGWTYAYTDDKIRGFKQTHQPSPWMNDYGWFSLMPVTTGPVCDEEARASWFSHKTETASPYLYSVYLADHDTFVEMTATERAAAFRFTYPEREMSYLVVDGADLRIEDNRITGAVSNHHGGVPEGFRTWFVVESDTPFAHAEVVDGRYALVGFPTTKGQRVHVKASSSFISPAQALVNLGETGDGGFDRLVAEGRAAWNALLGRIRVEDRDQDHLRTFYSCLYRCLLFPRDFSEIDAEGNRIHYSPHDGRVYPGYLFTDTGVWDTFRSLFALVYLVYPDQAAKMVEGMANHYRESGLLPEWASPGHRDCMVGNNSASVVAEACLKGIPGDYDLLWEAVVKGAHTDRPGTASGRKGWSWYDSLGYVPCDVGINESAARTLEYAYDDWCIWRMGQALGRPEGETGPYRKASGNYRNLFRTDVGLMGGRRADGSFPADFNPFRWGGDFTEGNALQYTWSVFHDIPGLMELMGGPEAFERAMDSLFDMPPIFDDSYYGFTIHEIREMQIMKMGNYAHGNQPIQHMLYLYDWCGAPRKAQTRIREVMERFYTPAPDGYCGDEDNGQTSAWYVFSAMGFYPVCPVSCQYALGSPLFDRVTVRLPSGKVLIIQAENQSADHVHVEKATLNGKRLDAPFLSHGDLSSGATLRLRMAE